LLRDAVSSAAGQQNAKQLQNINGPCSQGPPFILSLGYLNAVLALILRSFEVHFNNIVVSKCTS